MLDSFWLPLGSLGRHWDPLCALKGATIATKALKIEVSARPWSPRSPEECPRAPQTSKVDLPWSKNGTKIIKNSIAKPGFALENCSRPGLLAPGAFTLSVSLSAVNLTCSGRCKFFSHVPSPSVLELQARRSGRSPPGYIYMGDSHFLDDTSFRTKVNQVLPPLPGRPSYLTNCCCKTSGPHGIIPWDYPYALCPGIIPWDHPKGLSKLMIFY